MRLFSILLLLFTSAMFAQPLTLTIDSIISIEEREGNEKNRIFTVKYYLKNNTNDTLSFFFEPKQISPSTGGSMTKEIYYKIFENNKFIEIGLAFNQFTSEETNFNFDETVSKEQRDSIIIALIAKKVEEEPAKLFKIFKEKGIEGVLDPSNDYIQNIYKKRNNYYHTLLPNQTEHLEATFKWNKNRYYYHEPNEFYLDENAKHYFEITLVALKEEFKGKVDVELFEKIMKNPNFIKGVFVSNKVEIDFSGN